MEVTRCCSVTFSVDFWVVFGCWFAFLGGFESGRCGLFSLVCMVLCWVVVVVDVNAC